MERIIRETNVLEKNVLETNVLETNLLEENVVERNVLEANFFERNLCGVIVWERIVWCHQGSLRKVSDSTVTDRESLHNEDMLKVEKFEYVMCMIFY